jgi:hypothetical protein
LGSLTLLALLVAMALAAYLGVRAFHEIGTANRTAMCLT